MHNLLEILIFTLRNFTKLPVVRYFGICNVLHIWHIWVIPTYRVYRLYDYYKYKNNRIKLKDEVGMAVPKNTQIRFVGITYHIQYISLPLLFE